MRKYTALIAALISFLALPSLASAAPTASHITTPANPAFVTIDRHVPSTLHVAGVTSGGAGAVDIRCYYGAKAPLLATAVPVANGSFSTDISLDGNVLDTTLGYPYPDCVLRAVPTGTVPAAPPNAGSEWEGPYVGFGGREIYRLGAYSGPNSPDTMYDYFFARPQSAAMNDFLGVSSCGLCDTWLYTPGSKVPSNPIWWSNAALFMQPTGISDRTALNIDGSPAYSGYSAYYNGNPAQHLADNPGFPAVSATDTVDPATGDLTIPEHDAFAKCAEDPSVFPPTDASCTTFADTGVALDREIHTADNGLRVTIVDHWKSVDGKAHSLDAIYEDTERSANAMIAGREARADFTWTQGGFTTYPANTQIPVPGSVPATMLVKTDASTPDFGDNVNPFGAMTFGSQPDGLKLVKLGDATGKQGIWQTHYRRTIPAGGEVSIAVAYSHDFTLMSVQDKAKAAATAIAAPSVTIDSPADGGSVDTPAAHVTGSVSSPDGHGAVKVNGVDASVANGQWSADVPLADGVNTISAVASNALGVTTTVSRSVTRVAPATVTVPAIVPPVVKQPVRCVVPKLRGKTLAAARRALVKAHCRLGKVARTATSKVKPGRVVATRFKAGSRHPAGTRVRLTIAKAVRR